VPEHFLQYVASKNAHAFSSQSLAEARLCY
jgi:hypothetical protein